MKKIVFILTNILMILFTNCNEDKGSSINAPQVEPPVTRNMPAGMINLSLKSDDFVSTVDDNGVALGTYVISEIKNYLYPEGGGPSPIRRMSKIDERMAELDRRAQESQRKCLEDSLTSYDLPAAFPTSETLSTKINCYESLNETSELSFGSDDSNFYLIEKTGSSEEDEAHFVTAVTNLEGTSIDTWTVSYQNNQGSETTAEKEANLMHIKATDDSGIEVTTAGTLSGYSLSCGIHLKSNNSYVYIKGKLSIGYECKGEGSYCMDASTLSETDMVNCTDAGLDVFELISLTQEDVTSKLDDITTITDSKVSGVTSFNEDANS